MQRTVASLCLNEYTMPTQGGNGSMNEELFYLPRKPSYAFLLTY